LQKKISKLTEFAMDISEFIGDGRKIIGIRIFFKVNKSLFLIKLVFALKFSFSNISWHSILLFNNLKRKIKYNYFLLIFKLGMLKNPDTPYNLDGKGVQHFI